MIAWLVAALRPSGPYPILVVNGEHGSGKSLFSRMLRLLVDPSAAAIRTTPKDERDLIVSASNSHVLGFDNLSKVEGWLSDAFCRLSTGGGFATSTLHTDHDETVFDGQRPLLLNGISLLTNRADLADRALTINLRTLSEHDYLPEDELKAGFESARPRILGALLDAVSAAVRNLPSTRLSRAVRMADFAKWITAAEPALCWEPGRFGAVYRDNRRNVADSSFEADPVAVAISDFVVAEHPAGWSGTATELLFMLNARVNETIKKQRIWPQVVQSLGNRIDRIAPLLRGKGFEIERRHSGCRTIIIKPPPPPQENTP